MKSQSSMRKYVYDMKLLAKFYTNGSQDLKKKQKSIERGYSKLKYGLKQTLNSSSMTRKQRELLPQLEVGEEHYYADLEFERMQALLEKQRNEETFVTSQVGITEGGFLYKQHQARIYPTYGAKRYYDSMQSKELFQYEQQNAVEEFCFPQVRYHPIKSTFVDPVLHIDGSLYHSSKENDNCQSNEKNLDNWSNLPESQSQGILNDIRFDPTLCGY